MRCHTMWRSTAWEVVLVVVHVVIVMVAAAVALLFMVHIIFPQVVQNLYDFAVTCCYFSFMFW